MSHLARFLVFATIAATLVACGGVAGSGNPATEPRTVTAFSKLEVAGGVHVTFTTGPRSVSITADDNLIRHVETVVRDGTLIVRLTHPVLDTSGITARISNDVLEGLGLSGGSSFTGPVTATENLDLAASGGSTAEISGAPSSHVSANASGGSELTLVGGSAKRLSLNASGGSKILSHGFAAEDGIVDVSGGSSICVLCTKSISGNASGGSTITLSGNPAITNVESSGGSRLIKDN